MRKSVQWFLALGALSIIAITACVLIEMVRQLGGSVTRPMETAAALPGSIGTKAIALLPQVTPTVYPDSVVVVRAIRQLTRLETASYTIEKVIVAEQNQDEWSLLFGDRLLLVAHGEVIAGIDLGKVSAGDIVTTQNGTVYFIKPAAEVFVTAVDNDKTYVYDRQTGVLTKGNTHLETAARQAAQHQIEEAALEDGILDVANENATRYLEQLILTLGFEEVIFTTATPLP